MSSSEQNPYAQASDKAGKPEGRTLTIVGAVLAGLALVVVPIVLGPLGAILGFVANSKGDKPYGMYVGIAGIVTTVVGMALGAAVLASMG